MIPPLQEVAGLQAGKVPVGTCPEGLSRLVAVQSVLEEKQGCFLRVWRPSRVLWPHLSSILSLQGLFSSIYLRRLD